MNNTPATIKLFLITVSLFLSTHITNAQITWAPIGPGGGGWLTAITVINDDVVYVGCDVGGIYKSTDQGNTWVIKNAGLSTYFIQDIAYDPTNPNILYLATREGIFKSTDAGENWVIKRSGFPAENDYNYSAPIIDIVVDQNSPNILYAGVGLRRNGFRELDGYHWETSVIKGAIYKSTDYGENWTIIYNTGIDNEAMIYSLAIDPLNSNIIYTATSKGVYKSIDAGATWSPINTGLPHELTMNIVINPSDSNILYVTLYAEPSATSSDWFGGVYKSTNAGNSWIFKSNGLAQETGASHGFTSNYTTLLIDENHPNILYTGNYCWTPDPGVYKTTNGGDSWDWVSDSDANMNIGWIDNGTAVNCMAINPTNSNQLYFGTSMLLFKTDNAGAYWNQVYTDETTEPDYWKGNGLETTCVENVVIDPTNSDNIYVAYWDLGFLKSIDGGESYKKTAIGMSEEYSENVFAIVVDPTNPSIIYASTGYWDTNEGELCKSFDFGENWEIINTVDLPRKQIWSLALDKNSPEDARILYAACYEKGVYKTTNGGANWFAVNNGLGMGSNKLINKIVIDPNDSNILYAGFESETDEETTMGGLFKSTDAGQSWIRIDTDLPQINVRDIIIDPNDSQTIYTAVASGYNHSEGIYYYGGVYKSIDGGSSWENLNTDFGDGFNLEISSIALSPANSAVIYATTTDSPFHDQSSGRGIFKSTNSGNDWTAVNTGLSLLNFSSITIDPLNPYLLYAGSGGNGVIKGIDSEFIGIDEVSQSLLQQISVVNTPNPFDTHTIIKFDLPTNQNVTLKIYDNNGRLIQTLLDKQERKSGVQNISWNGKDNNGRELSSGIYFCHVITDSYVAVGRIVLLR